MVNLITHGRLNILIRSREEAVAFIKYKLENDYYFLPFEAEEKWIKQLMEENK